MALPIILDCDPSHDDAIAIVLALASKCGGDKAVRAESGKAPSPKRQHAQQAKTGWLE